MKTHIHKHRRRGTHVARRIEPGAAPGHLTADPEAPKPVIRAVAYGPREAVEREISNLEEIADLLQHWPVTWIRVEGLGDVDVIAQLGLMFGMHRLTLEDVLNQHQRPKVEEYEDHLFIVGRRPSGPPVDSSQLSLFLGSNFLVSFHDQADDYLAPVLERIRHGRGPIRGAGPDYLAYALLDLSVDQFFPLLEYFDDQLEALEAKVLERPERQEILQIRAMKRELRALWRLIWPLRDAVQNLDRKTLLLIGAETRVYLRDCYDHAILAMELAQNLIDQASDLSDFCLTIQTHQTNQVMRVLTVFAAIFIPLTFIAGVYGMNFDPGASRWNMPELHWVFGYPFALTLMLVVALGTLWVFRRKGWVGPAREGEDEDRPPDETEDK